MDNIRIIQSSPAQTGSTLLLNLVHGFLSPTTAATPGGMNCKVNDLLITKTHNIKIDELIHKYPKYKLYFVMSERNDNKINRLINDKYRNYDNVLIINYNDINVINSLSLDNVIDNLFNTFKHFFPKKMIPKKEDMLIKEDMKKRIIDMNKVVEKTKNKNFSYWDKFYGIRGGHRNRPVLSTDRGGHRNRPVLSTEGFAQARTNMNNIRIIQSSPAHTGSTLLLNLVHGFLSPTIAAEPVGNFCKVNDLLITKTHNIKIDELIHKYPEYKLYFVMSERNDNKIKRLIYDKHRNYDNVLIINYNEINVINSLSLDNVIDNLFNKFKHFFPKKIIPKKEDMFIKEDMKKRIIDMNKVVEKTKNKKFSYWDRFYGIRGGHRNRPVLSEEDRAKQTQKHLQRVLHRHLANAHYATAADLFNRINPET